MHCDEGLVSQGARRESTHPFCRHQRSGRQLLALEWNEKLHSHVQGLLELSVEVRRAPMTEARQEGYRPEVQPSLAARSASVACNLDLEDRACTAG
jgi:hypothetical protein